MRVGIHTFAAANVTLRTELAPALIERLKHSHLVIAPFRPDKIADASHVNIDLNRHGEPHA